MTVVLLDGFDDVSATQLTSKGWSVNPSSMQAGTPDGQAIRFSNTGGGTPTKRSLPSALSTVIMGFAWRTDQQPTTNTILRLLNVSTRVADLQVINGASHNVRVVNAAGSTVATGTTNFSANTWLYIEIKLVVGTSGTVEVKVNGNTEIGSTIGNFGSLNVDGFQLMNSNSNASTVVNSDFDDLYVVDPSSSPNNSYLADTSHIPHVRTLYPNGDGAHTDWIPDTGSSHYSRVNENPAPDGDTSYVSTSTVGARDSYTFDDLTLITAVKAVQINAYAKSDDLSTHQVDLVARPSSTDSDGSAKTLLTSGYQMFSDIRETNPDTSAAWTPSEVNAAEFGVKFVS